MALLHGCPGTISTRKTLWPSRGRFQKHSKLPMLQSQGIFDQFLQLQICNGEPGKGYKLRSSHKHSGHNQERCWAFSILGGSNFSIHLLGGNRRLASLYNPQILCSFIPY